MIGAILIKRLWVATMRQHDIAVRELGSGKSRLETARTMGIVFQVAPNVSIDDGIQAARAIMPRCWFNQDHCKDGLRGA